MKGSICSTSGKVFSDPKEMWLTFCRVFEHLTRVKFSVELLAFTRNCAKKRTLLTHKNKKKRSVNLCNHTRLWTLFHTSVDVMSWLLNAKKKKERYKGRHRCKSHIKDWSACIAYASPSLLISSDHSAHAAFSQVWTREKQTSGLDLMLWCFHDVFQVVGMHSKCPLQIVPFRLRMQLILLYL